jgi:mitochondrial fission protein ELM1
MPVLPLAADRHSRGTPPARPPLVWVLHDGKAGMASQALGLAEATGFPFVEKSLRIRLPWRALPPQLWLMPLLAAGRSGARLAPPWPDLVIGCGRNAAMPALALRRIGAGTVAAQVQDPRVGHAEFDLMVVPEHDGWRGPRVLVTRTAMHRVTPEKLAGARRRFAGLAALPHPVVTVLIGGTNRAYRLTRQRLGDVAQAIADILRATGGSALVTPSRRTGSEGMRLLRERLEGLPGAIWDGTGENPYFAYLAAADAVLVTADSVSMVSEAAATGRPVHVIELDGGNRKFRHFHAAMRQAGITRPFKGRLESWSYTIPDDTARAGAALRALVLDRLQG